MTFHVTLQQRPLAFSAADLSSAREEAVSALEAIDARFERERDAIRNWPGSQQAKDRLLARLHARRRAEREPLVQWLLGVGQSAAAA